jgi:HSP20 family protein
MKKTDPHAWMWSDALEMLNRAERMHRQMFQPAQAPAQSATRQRVPCWEPPVDLLETERELLVLAALPGVDPEQIHVAIHNGALTITGERTLPPELRTATIHGWNCLRADSSGRSRCRRARYEVARPSIVNGTLAIVLRKLT